MTNSFFKAIGKKAEKIGKKKGNGAILDWVQSIKNHVYWCAATSEGKELFNHLIDVHDSHGEIYKECPHGNIVRDWLKKGKMNFKF